MTPNTTPIERALDFAKSGRCRTTADLFALLKKEGYQPEQVVGLGSSGSFEWSSMRLTCLDVAPEVTPTAAFQTAA